MSDITKVEIGQALPKETWLAVRDDLAEVFPIIGKLLRMKDYEGQGERDEAEFMMEAQLALQALTYVGEFASDKCRIIVLPDRRK